MAASSTISDPTKDVRAAGRLAIRWFVPDLLVRALPDGERGDAVRLKAYVAQCLSDSLPSPADPRWALVHDGSLASRRSKAYQDLRILAVCLGLVIDTGNGMDRSTEMGWATLMFEVILRVTSRHCAVEEACGV